MCELCHRPEVGAPDAPDRWPDDEDEPMTVNDMLAALGSRFRVPDEERRRP